MTRLHFPIPRLDNQHYNQQNAFQSEDRPQCVEVKSVLKMYVNLNKNGWSERSSAEKILDVGDEISKTLKLVHLPEAGLHNGLLNTIQHENERCNWMC